MQRRRHLPGAENEPTAYKIAQYASLDVLRRKIAICSRREDAVVRGTRRAA
jgi:hypothetical protein